MEWMIVVLVYVCLVGGLDARGISKKRHAIQSFQQRFADFIDETRFPCELPSITPRLPVRIKTKIELIWKDVDKNANNCWTEMARTRNILLRLTSEERAAILKPSDKCKAPLDLDHLPSKYQKKLNDIWSKSGNRLNGDCWEQQKKTRLLLLNMPIGVKEQPPSFQCALPHFYNRLEQELQDKLRSIWNDFKPGQSCVEQIDQQIQLLEANDISIKSFQMPPPSMFKKRELLRKLRRRANVAK